MKFEKTLALVAALLGVTILIAGSAFLLRARSETGPESKANEPVIIDSQTNQADVSASKFSQPPQISEEDRIYNNQVSEAELSVNDHMESSALAKIYLNAMIIPSENFIGTDLRRFNTVLKYYRGNAQWGGMNTERFESGLKEAPDENGYEKPVMARKLGWDVTRTVGITVDAITGKVYAEENGQMLYGSKSMEEDRKQYFADVAAGKIDPVKHREEILAKIKGYGDEQKRIQEEAEAKLRPPPRPRIPAGWPQDQPETWKPIPGQRGELALKILNLNPGEFKSITGDLSDATTKARHEFQATINPKKNNNAMTPEEEADYIKRKDLVFNGALQKLKNQFFELNDLDNDGKIQGDEVRDMINQFLRAKELYGKDDEGEIIQRVKVGVEYFDYDGDGALSPAEWQLMNVFQHRLSYDPRIGPWDVLLEK